MALSGAMPAGLGASQPGPQWTPQMVPGAAGLQDVLVPYACVIAHLGVAASGTNNLPSAIQIGEWPFLWTTLHVGSSDGDEPADEGFSFLLSDESIGSTFMSDRIMSRNLMAEGPITLPAPYLFREGAAIRSEVENYDTGAAQDCYVVLGGWLVQPRIVDGQWDSVVGLREFLGSPWGYPLPTNLGTEIAPLPYFYNVRSASMAGAAAHGTDTQDPAFTVGGREFVWLMTSATPEAGTSGIRLSIRDSQSRQGFSRGNSGNDRIPSITLMQHGPIVNPLPYMLPKGSSLAVTFENLDESTARFGRATFGGVLL